MIEYQNVSKSYGEKMVVKDLSLTVSKGEFVSLIGPSGCGKTTTLKMLNRLIPFDSGRILIDGKDVMTLNPEKLRTGIGYVIQQIGLFPNMTVEENISVVPSLLKWDKKRTAERVRELMEMVNMPYDEYAHKYPNQMSGGQQQRVGVLRALASEPDIILMDEPFGALDPITRDLLQVELRALQKSLGKTILFVTHDMNEALKMSDQIVFLHEGEIMQQASPDEMLRNPANDVIKEFLGLHVSSLNSTELLCQDVMREPIFTLYAGSSVRDCVRIMNEYNIDSVVVVNANGQYVGVVHIETIHTRGRTVSSLMDLIAQDLPVVTVDQTAKEAFDQLVDRNNNFVLVLSDKQKPVGFITRTSLSKAMANVVWGDEQ